LKGLRISNVYPGSFYKEITISGGADVKSMAGMAGMAAEKHCTLAVISKWVGVN